jgi:hypothetical protein
MNRLIALTLAAAIAVLAPGRSAVARKPDKIIRLKKADHLEWAQKIVEGIRWRQTKYRHSATAVYWKGVGGQKQYRSFADCSGFLNRLLPQAYGLSDADLNRWLKIKSPAKRPLARDYFQAIKDGNKFQAVTKIPDVRAGDIIAIKYLPGDPNNDERNSGHVLLAAARPKARAATEPKRDNTQQWSVKVFDQSNSGHGPADTRYGGKDKDGKPQFKDGLGQGVFRLYTDRDGNVTGHTWSLGPKSVFYDQKTRPLLIGRLQLGR